MRKKVTGKSAIVGPLVEYGGFWRRLGAALFDGLIIGAISSVLPPAIPLVSWLYYTVLESSEKQATIGKMALKLVVTDMNGNRISFVTATIRHFSKILSALMLFLGFVMIAFDAKKQGLHDKIAGTLVIIAKK